ncbi:MAG: ParA family protein [Symplocastrum torsivum CPER-KK1]|jgi:chromosome partitioning protein|uniref:ParA family protein n=1 Tax=Symplocastrum torsivum CPER-KK1 TaxID=450513 RepID=A0A951PTA0_9CYAN|nr:ParA family protein [Symplocastrum torsivum CPER-KK1]
MKILTVTGYKGGVGKSVTAVHLATFFSELGKTVLVDGDPNRTALGWNNRGQLPFTVADERQAMKVVSGSDFVIIDTPARPNSDDLKELAKGCDLLILPTAPDVLSLQPMLETARDLGEANYRALITIVPSYPSREGEVMKKDLKQGGVPVFETMIRRTVGFPKAALAGIPIRDLDEPRALAAWADYEGLGSEIREMWK